MKKIIIIILLTVSSMGLTSFVLVKKDTNNLSNKSTEDIKLLPYSDKMEVINLINEEQWN